MAEEEIQFKNPMTLGWVFGFKCDEVDTFLNLCDPVTGRKAIFYAAGHTGVIYDLENEVQLLLQGHCNAITSVCASLDKRWIATADSGVDSVIIVWDSTVGTPVQTIMQPHGDDGVRCMAMSNDSSLLATLSMGENQSLSLWDWTVSDENEPENVEVNAPSVCLVAEASVPVDDDQMCIRFHPTNPDELVSNGASRAIFWTCDREAEGETQTVTLNYDSPTHTAREFKHSIGSFTQSVYLPSSDKAVSATSSGELVLWEVVQGDLRTGDTRIQRRTTKALRAHHSPINVMAIHGESIVTGGEDGVVRFHDFGFRLMTWIDNLNVGPIMTISFPAEIQEEEDNPFAALEQEKPVMRIQDFVAPDFFVCSRQARTCMVTDASENDHTITPIVVGQDGAVTSISAHPSQPLLAVCGASTLAIWDYSTKQMVSAVVFDKAKPKCVAFDHVGDYITVGFTSGAVRVLDPMTLEVLATFKHSKNIVHTIDWSPDGKCFATADDDFCVALYRLQKARALRSQDEKMKPEVEWVHVGKYRSHDAQIVGLRFTESEQDKTNQRLFSLGSDRFLCEFDVNASTVKGGVVLKNATKIIKCTDPTALTLHPTLGQREDLFIMAFDDYKLRLFNTNSLRCRRTALGPTFGGPVDKIVVFPPSISVANHRFLAYSTGQKIVGLASFPLDGNSRSSMGIIAHPGEVTALAVGYDGHVFTAGGADGTVNMWRTELETLLQSRQSAGVGVAPFISLLEGGREGPLYEEMVEYFYYSQLHHQGEGTTDKRKVTATVPLSELASMCRALGYYPNESEIQNMIDEVKFESYNTESGEAKNSADLDTFIKLYVNHRPVRGMSGEEIRSAFEILGAEPITGTLGMDMMTSALQQYGERMSAKEVQECLTTLLGDDARKQLGDDIKSDQFCRNVLGLQDEEESVPNEEEMEENLLA